MSEPETSIWTEKRRAAVASLRNGWQVMLKRGPSQFQFWVIALIIGIAQVNAAENFERGRNATN